MSKKKGKNKKIYKTNNKQTNKKTLFAKQNKNKEKSKKKFSEKHPRISLFIKIIILLILALMVVATGVIVGMIYGGWGDDFEISEDELIIGSSNSIILDKDGNKLAELSGEDNRKIIKLDEMPKNLKDAYVSIEDERFYEHNGIDIKRTGGAIIKYIIHRGNASFGGSTITQQLVKNITQEKDRSGMAGIIRKVKEWAKAYQIERMISKDQILELYLNIIFVGGNNNNLGVEVGSEYYFNKPAKDLSLAECAFLAGINHSPNKYNPYSENDHTEIIKTRTKTVLKKMLDLGKIEKTEYDEAIAKVDEGLTFEKSNALGNLYSYHTDATISQVIEDIAKEKGISTSLASAYVYSSGLTIHSTQDTELQNKMNEVMVEKSGDYIRKSKLVDGATSQSAMVIIDNSTGFVVGVVGGLGEKTESRGLNRATQSPRQTGSSIKPLTSLVPGINEGIITAATVYDDNKTRFPGNYEPKDYNAFKGLVSIRSAVTTSQNIPFIKVVSELTPSKSTDYLQKMGVSTVEKDRDILAALSIGGFTDGITPLEMAGCYATIANDGVYRRPMFYSQVTDANGGVVLDASTKQTTQEVISKQAAYIIKNILQSVVNSGTATYCKISGQDVAAKTGTTNSNYDKWLCGFTNLYTASCWYGFDKNEEVVGSTNVAGRIWSAVMTKVHSGRERSSFARPDGIVSATICKASGRRATSKCSDTYSEIFVAGTVPAECDAHANSAEVCESSGLLANPNCPNKVTRYFSYTVDKERLGLWKSLNSSVTNPPTTYCTEHTAQNNGKPKKEEPTITLNGETNMNLNVGETYKEQGAKATDDTDGDITSKLQISGTVNTSKAGSYVITYKVKNSKGKETVAKRTVTVKEKQEAKPNDKNNVAPQNTQANTNTEPKPEQKSENTTEPKPEETKPEQKTPVTPASTEPEQSTTKEEKVEQ